MPLPLRSPAIQFWGGFETDDVNKYNKIVMAPCNGGKLISFYCFYPASANVRCPPREDFRLTSFSPLSQSELSTTSKEGFNVQDVSVADLVSPFSQLDPDCLRMLNSSIDRKPWRLYEHTPLTGWTQGRTGLLGDACHAMFPHQSQ
jgi:salicylate hydroxylase